ncbi:hypothetical protein ACLOJK_000072 [Asimina triloba]
MSLIIEASISTAIGYDLSVGMGSDLAFTWRSDHFKEEFELSVELLVADALYRDGHVNFDEKRWLLKRTLKRFINCLKLMMDPGAKETNNIFPYLSNMAEKARHLRPSDVVFKSMWMLWLMTWLMRLDFMVEKYSSPRVSWEEEATTWEDTRLRRGEIVVKPRG